MGAHVTLCDMNEERLATGQGHEITITQNSHFDKGDLGNLTSLVARGQVTFAPLIQDIVPVTEADRLYTLLRDEPAKLKGTVFVW